MDILFEQLYAEGVEGADVTQVQVADFSADTCFHLVGCAVGEGRAEDVLRKDAQIPYNMDIALGERLRLAGAGTRRHAYRAFGGVNGGKLFGV